MSKPILSLVGLCVLALAYPANRAIANSTEDSDRQFLANLENRAAPQPAPAPAPATAAPTTKPESTATESAPIPKATAVVKKTADKAPKPVAGERIQQLPSMADGNVQAAAAPVPETKVYVTKTTETEIDPDHDRDRHHHFFHRLFGHILSNHPEDW